MHSRKLFQVNLQTDSLHFPNLQRIHTQKDIFFFPCQVDTGENWQFPGLIWQLHCFSRIYSSSKTWRLRDEVKHVFKYENASSLQICRLIRKEMCHLRRLWPIQLRDENRAWNSFPNSYSICKFDPDLPLRWKTAWSLKDCELNSQWCHNHLRPGV